MNSDTEVLLREIQKRNARVERDKAWETSWTRRLLLLGLTYFVCSVVFTSIGVSNPWSNALVPSTGFFLSTLTLNWCKRRWLARHFGGEEATGL